MKIVINACFGGFGLSEKAIRMLLATDCPHIEKHDPKKYYGSEDWEKKFKEDKNRDSTMFKIIGGKIITDEHRNDCARTCNHLISVVDALGKEANSWASELEVVEIPDGVEFEIEEYDGNETIAEVHRTWR